MQLLNKNIFFDIAPLIILVVKNPVRHSQVFFTSECFTSSSQSLGILIYDPYHHPVPGADPGCPVFRRGANLRYCQNFPKKLHEIEKFTLAHYDSNSNSKIVANDVKFITKTPINNSCTYRILLVNRAVMAAV